MNERSGPVVQRIFADSLARSLVEIALADPDRGLELWRRLALRPEDATRHAAALFYPTIYKQLASQLQPGEGLAELRASYQRTLSKNVVLLRGVRDVFDHFREQGIPALALKGVAMFGAYRNDVGRRVLGDCDLLVPPRLVHRAASLLVATGWTFHWDVSLACFVNEIVPTQHSFGLRRGHAELDLHWHGLHQDISRASDDATFDHAYPMFVLGQEMRRPCSTDLLFHSILHGIRGAPEHLDWVMDVDRLLRNPYESIDWVYLMTRVQNQHFQEIFKLVLSALREEFGIAIPTTVMSTLRSQQWRPLQRAELAALSPLFSKLAAPSNFGVNYMREVRRQRPSILRTWLKLVERQLRKSLFVPGNRHPLCDLCLRPVRRFLRLKRLLERHCPSVLYKEIRHDFPLLVLEPGAVYRFGEGAVGNSATQSGWSNPEPGFIWSVDNQPVLRMKAPAAGPLLLEFQV